MEFKEFNLNDQMSEAISYMGYVKATPIQERAIPEILKGNDLIACAQTGTGKTAAFLLPILHKITESPNNTTNTLIIVPTRELALQIDQQIQGFTYFTPISSIPVYGGGDGSDWEQQKRALSKGADIIVATPGKLISHLNMDYVKFDTIEHLILDEADRMLDIGFYDDIIKIISFLPTKRQTLMFSATMPPTIKQLASKILTKPIEINISISKPAEGVLHAAYLTYDTQKDKLLSNLIDDKPEYESILIFCSTKRKVFQIVRSINGKKYSVAGISSDLEQEQREEVLLKFRSKQTRVLVATDVLSRGIDIKNIELIINYDVPNDAEDYVHRVGRTARAETTGVALTLVNEDDMYKFHKIEEFIEKEIMKIPLPAEIGESPKWEIKPMRKKGNYKPKYKGKKGYLGKSGKNYKR